MISENENMVSIHFDSIIELMDANPESNFNRNRFNNIMNLKSDGQRWDNGKSSKETINLALFGDSEIYQKSLPMMEKLDSYTGKTELQRVQKVKRIKFKSDTGDELDIHKIYQGNASQAWSKTKRIEIDSKHHLVTLFLNINGSAGTKFNDTIWRCAVITKLTNELQRAGKSVKVIVGGIVTRAMRGSRKNLSISINVKKYNETLSPERLAAMSNIGFYRVFGFAAKEFQDKIINGNGGQSITACNSMMPIELKKEVEQGHTKSIFISGVTSEHEARQELKFVFNQMQNF